jgi:hypothetical protein
MPSTVIDRFHHDPGTGVLTVVFRTGRVYAYHGVPASEVAALRSAESKGRYFNAHIRGHYPYDEIQQRA